MTDEDQPLGFAEIRSPSDYTNEEIAALGVPAIVAACEHGFGFNYERLLCISVGAAQMSKSATSQQRPPSTAQRHANCLARLQSKRGRFVSLVRPSRRQAHELEDEGATARVRLSQR